MRWALVAVFVMGFAWLRLPVLAQDAEPLRLSALEIALWPEFDKPEVLVIIQGRLADDVPLPAELTLTMPQEAGEPHAVAWVDEAGQLLNAEYVVQVEGDATKITYTSLEGRGFQFEYYLDALQIEGERRHFTFRYRLDTSVDDLMLELQQPSGAANVVLNPPPVETSPGFAGLTYHRLPLGAMDVGQTVEWRVSYDKSDSRLSAEALSTDSPGPVATPAAALPSGTGTTAGALVVAGVALALAVATFWLLNSRQPAKSRQLKPRSQEAKLPRPKKRKDRKGARPLVHSTEPTHGFCHRCGAPLKEDALFCHRCGTRRKGA